MDGPATDKVSYALYTGYPLLIIGARSGAQIIFRSLLQPLFARFFNESPSAGLRSQADSATSKNL
jgi:hypothetical protein